MTMTTVGFGEMSPRTPLGRIVASICVTWGVLVVAVMVAVLTNLLGLDRKEIQSLIVMKRIENKEEVRLVAGKYLRTALWRVWNNHKGKLSKHEDSE